VQAPPSPSPADAERERSERLAWLPFLLQTADALFPTGAYAHSLGFEETVRLGIVRDEATLGRFLRLQITPALAHLELPYLRWSAEAAGRGDIELLCALDREIDAWKLAAETRAASVQLGIRRLKALRVLAPDAPVALDFERRIAGGEARGHHIAACGVQAAVAALPLRAALAAYFYQAHAATCAAALKLIRIGQDGCQRVLREACGEAEDAVSRSLRIELCDAGWFNPLLEIASMRHTRADERLFIS
jgi:urease accessory protein